MKSAKDDAAYLPAISIVSPFGEVAQVDHIKVRIALLKVKWPSLTPPETVEAAWLGIDPGQVNMGLVSVQRGAGKAMQIQMPSKLDTKLRIYYTNMLMSWALSQIPMANLACVEHAAYGAAFGQVPLSEHRTTVIINLMRRGWPVTTAAPAAIRKLVLGKGTTLAQEVWPTLRTKMTDSVWHYDTASALACALYAARANFSEAPQLQPSKDAPHAY